MQQGSIDVRAGHAKILWARNHMPLLGQLRPEFIRDQPFRQYRVGMSIHLEAKTACLAILLRDGGADVAVTGSNPLSTQDDVAAALATEDRIDVFARHGASEQQYTDDLCSVLRAEPDLILDDGGDLVDLLHGRFGFAVLGGCEETTTGVARLRVRNREGRLRFPMIAVNDARMKYLFDNRYGTGQSTWDAIMRSTNLVVAGKSVVVVGYGWCGKGIARRARGLGGRVTVCEVDPVRAVEALMDGHHVAAVREAIATANVLITATGCIDAVPGDALEQANDGLILANAGHFDVEISKAGLTALAEARDEVRPGVEAFRYADGRTVYLLGDGRLVNLVLGDGHPAEIMDISFAVQALALRHITESDLSPGLHRVPEAIDRRVAAMKLSSEQVMIDVLSERQQVYLGLQSCSEGE